MAKIALWKATEEHTINGTTMPVEFSTEETLKALVPSFDSALGYTVEEVRQRGKLMDALEQEGVEEIEVSKPLAEMLLKRMEHYRVTVPSINLIKLQEQLQACL